ncbi:MAG: hypothetical protein Q9219_007196 [cf. Caloplaca sp. 3 TL-2023]
MATPFSRLGSAFLRQPRQRPYRSQKWTTVAYRRTFRSNPVYQARRRDDDDDDADPRQTTPQPYSFNYDLLDPETRHHYDLLSSEDKLRFQKEEKASYEHMTSPALESKLQGLVSQAIGDIQRQTPPREPTPRINPGLMATGEVDEQGSGEDDDFEGDDISSTAHGELEQHREMREYARIAAWEMPMLSSMSLWRNRPQSLWYDDANVVYRLEFAKPFELPGKDKPLRFRYTTYMGETHPASKKVVLEFCTRDLPDLTEAQRIKLVKLVGVRYNPDDDLVKMSCEMFETQAQNKRYLGDLVDTLVAESKDATDMFEDVPLDFRHHKPKPKFEFPEKWKMTEQRKEQLEAIWEQRALKDQERLATGLLIDGPEIIQKGLEAVAVRTSARAAVPPPRGPAGRRPLRKIP